LRTTQKVKKNVHVDIIFIDNKSLNLNNRRCGNSASAAPNPRLELVPGEKSNAKTLKQRKVNYE